MDYHIYHLSVKFSQSKVKFYRVQQHLWLLHHVAHTQATHTLSTVAADVCGGVVWSALELVGAVSATLRVSLALALLARPTVVALAHTTLEVAFFIALWS